VTRLVFSAALLILASFANAAVRYVPADDSIPLLRRDLIPMDVDAIRDLADYLAILADGPMPKSAVKVRHRAQLLTLSQRLLPGHERARSIETSYLKGGERRPPEAFFVKSARKTIIETADWLGQLPKEADGHLLNHTSVLFGSNLGNASSHSWRNLPILLAGGGYKHGHHVAHDPDNNTPFANLFLPLAQRMGLEIEKFGSSTKPTIRGLES